MSKRKQTTVKRDTGNPSINLDTYRRYARIDVYSYLEKERPTKLMLKNKIDKYKSFIKNYKILGFSYEHDIYTTEVIKELQYYYNNYNKVPF